MRVFYFLVATVFVIAMTVGAWHSLDGQHVDALDRAWTALKWFSASAAFGCLLALFFYFMDRRRHGD